ncbi:MAG: stage V sporulation protein AD [Eubacteriales bacterium]|nr:stage V sporulation protein AD [Eubacteriales bacterium]
MKNEKLQAGQQSVSFAQGVHILSSGTVVGEKEGQGPLGNLFDLVSNDPAFGEDNWEKAESTMQKEAIQMALGKAKMNPAQIRYLFGGDLLGQLIATSFGVEDLNLPLFGLYGACSTCGESLSLGAMAVSAGYADYVLAVTSSHFGSAEKQFRFPLAYGNQRPLSATWTVTGAGAFVLGTKGGHARITGVTTGKIVDFGVKDSMNMGACMAPAACDTIYQNLMDFNRQPQDYDRIITGDLGSVGQTILIDLLKEKGFDISRVHMDCGIEIYDEATQDTHAGGSGCGCSAVTLGAKILPELEKGALKRVLFVPTGALLSPVSFNEGQSVPGIAHGVVIEHC